VRDYVNPRLWVSIQYIIMGSEWDADAWFAMQRGMVEALGGRGSETRGAGHGQTPGLDLWSGVEWDSKNGGGIAGAVAVTICFWPDWCVVHIGNANAYPREDFPCLSSAGDRRRCGAVRCNAGVALTALFRGQRWYGHDPVGECILWDWGVTDGNSGRERV